jgi:hypothetical protein
MQRGGPRPAHWPKRGWRQSDVGSRSTQSKLLSHCQQARVTSLLLMRRVAGSASEQVLVVR